jgi:hypothetical protein
VAYYYVQRNKILNSATLKKNTVAWLERMGVNFPPIMKEPQLLEQTKLVRTEKLYLVDNIIKKYGRDALHIPPYHPDLNPTELVSGDINRVA